MEETEKLLDKQLDELKGIKTFIMAGDRIMKEILLELKDLNRLVREGLSKDGDVSRH